MPRPRRREGFFCAAGLAWSAEPAGLAPPASPDVPPAFASASAAGAGAASTGASCFGSCFDAARGLLVDLVLPAFLTGAAGASSTWTASGCAGAAAASDASDAGRTGFAASAAGLSAAAASAPAAAGSWALDGLRLRLRVALRAGLASCFASVGAGSWTAGVASARFGSPCPPSGDGIASEGRSGCGAGFAGSGAAAASSCSRAARRSASFCAARDWRMRAERPGRMSRAGAKGRRAGLGCSSPFSLSSASGSGCACGCSGSVPAGCSSVARPRPPRLRRDERAGLSRPSDSSVPAPEAAVPVEEGSVAVSCGASAVGTSARTDAPSEVGSALAAGSTSAVADSSADVFGAKVSKATISVCVSNAAASRSRRAERERRLRAEREVPPPVSGARSALSAGVPPLWSGAASGSVAATAWPPSGLDRSAWSLSTRARRSAAIWVIWSASSGRPNANPVCTRPSSSNLRRKLVHGESVWVSAVR